MCRSTSNWWGRAECPNEQELLMFLLAEEGYSLLTSDNPEKWLTEMAQG